MNDMNREKTWPSAIMFLLLAIGIIILVAVGFYALTQPGVLEATVKLILIVLVAIVAIAIIVYAVLALLAIPMYAFKGTSYQTNASYGLDKVEPVKEKGLEEDEEE